MIKMLTNVLLLLKIVGAKGSLLALRQRGLTHAQIATLLEEQINCGNIYATTDGIFLTDSGNLMLSQFYKEAKMSGPKAWVLPQYCFYTEPIEPAKIVLP